MLEANHRNLYTEDAATSSHQILHARAQIFNCQPFYWNLMSPKTTEPTIMDGEENLLHVTVHFELLDSLQQLRAAEAKTFIPTRSR